MEHRTDSWFGGGLGCGMEGMEGGRLITAFWLATGTESREMMRFSFFDSVSCFNKTCSCLLAIAASSSCSVERGVDTSFQDGRSRSRRADPMRLAVAMLLLSVSSNSPQDVSKFIRLS